MKLLAVMCAGFRTRAVLVDANVYRLFLIISDNKLHLQLEIAIGEWLPMCDFLSLVSVLR